MAIPRGKWGQFAGPQERHLPHPRSGQGSPVGVTVAAAADGLSGESRGGQAGSGLAGEPARRPEGKITRGTGAMRRLISMLAAGLLAAGAILTTVGAASADATTRQGCTPSGQDPLWVTSSGVNYYVATPNRTFSGATVRLRLNGTEWFGCLFPDGSQLVTTGTLALTSRATSPGGDVTVETPGNNGNGFASQHWNLVFSSAGLEGHAAECEDRPLSAGTQQRPEHWQAPDHRSLGHSLDAGQRRMRSRSSLSRR